MVAGPTPRTGSLLQTVQSLIGTFHQGDPLLLAGQIFPSTDFGARRRAMASSQHTTDIPLQTPRREVTNNEPPLPPLEDIPTEAARYVEITNEQLRSLCPVARNLVRDLRYAPIMEFLAHTRTPADNITRNGVMVSTIPELVNTMIEDLGRAVQENDPVLQNSEGFPDTEPFPEPQPDLRQWNNNQVYSPREEGEGGRRNEREGNTA